METLRRGKATEDAFSSARRAVSTYHTFGAPETAEEIPVATAHLVFLGNRAIKMSRRSDGSFVFIDPSRWGYTRFELFP
jgi:hypothetical protein